MSEPTKKMSAADLRMAARELAANTERRRRVVWSSVCDDRWVIWPSTVKPRRLPDYHNQIGYFKFTLVEGQDPKAEFVPLGKGE